MCRRGGAEEKMERESGEGSMLGAELEVGFDLTT